MLVPHKDRAPRELTDKQKTFLDALFDDAGGDIRAAMDLAGYSSNTPPSVVLDALCDEIVERSRRFLASHAPRAAMATVGIINDPTAQGNKVKLAAASEVLDRAGVVKKEKVEIESKNIHGIFILPSKRED